MRSKLKVPDLLSRSCSLSPNDYQVFMCEEPCKIFRIYNSFRDNVCIFSWFTFRKNSCSLINLDKIVFRKNFLESTWLSKFSKTQEFKLLKCLSLVSDCYASRPLLVLEGKWIQQSKLIQDLCKQKQPSACLRSSIKVHQCLCGPAL